MSHEHLRFFRDHDDTHRIGVIATAINVLFMRDHLPGMADIAVSY